MTVITNLFGLLAQTIQFGLKMRAVDVKSKLKSACSFCCYYLTKQGVNVVSWLFLLQLVTHCFEAYL